MNVPKLRFKEFNDEWITEKVGNTIDILMCKRIFASDTSDKGEIPFYKIGTIGSKPDAFISRELFEQYKNKYNYPRTGEVLITCSGTVGKCVIFDGNDSYYQDSNIVWLDNPTQKISNIFLYYYVSNVNWSRLNSTTIVRIYGDNLRNLKITYPSNKTEQEKITNAIKLVDKKIELQTKKIEDLKLFKKGLIEKIYLMDIYDKITLKNLFNSYGGTSLESYVSDKGTYNFISIGNYSMDGEYINNNQKIVLNDKTKDKLLNKNDLVMILNDKTSSGDIIGSTILIDEDNKYIYNQRSQRLVCKKEILPEYAWCYLNTSKHRRKVFSYSQGGTQIYINFSQIEKMKVLIPKDFKNQNIISTIIIDTCTKIKLNEIKMKELRKLKKGLMQNMFV